MSPPHILQSWMPQAAQPRPPWGSVLGSLHRGSVKLAWPGQHPGPGGCVGPGGGSVGPGPEPSSTSLGWPGLGGTLRGWSVVTWSYWRRHCCHLCYNLPRSQSYRRASPCRYHHLPREIQTKPRVAYYVKCHFWARRLSVGFLVLQTYTKKIY